MTTVTSVRSSILDGFDDPRATSEEWQALVSRMDAPVVFMTKSFQRAWWESFEPGELLLILVEREGRPVGLAPLFVAGGMGFLVGSGGSDYLDFIGDISEPDVLDSILATAREHIDEFIGFRFHHVLDSSATGMLLSKSASRLGLRVYDEGDLGAPALDVGPSGDELKTAADRRSLRRLENYLTREGNLSVHHSSDPLVIEPHLQAFFEQHIARWEGTEHPSLFLDEQQQRFYERLVQCGEGWIRFSRMEWNGAPVAFHFGFSFAGRYLFYKPTFDISLAKRSPGVVLLRHLFLASHEEGSMKFDFGLGEEPFKSRFSTGVDRVRTWGLYDPSVLGKASTS